MHWLVETCVLGEERVTEFRDALTALSLPRTFTFDVDQPPEIRRPRPDQGAAVIAYGSKSVIAYSKKMEWRPGVWSSTLFDYAAVQNGIGDIFLNQDAAVTSLSQIETVAQKITNGTVFLRPADDDKAFAGTTIEVSDIALWRSRQLASGYLPTAAFDVVVATPKTIKREWRIVIAGENIAGSSLYREAGERKLACGSPREVADFALVAATRYRPAPVFIADIAEVDTGELAVVEYNAFNSADLYACDIASVVHHVTNIAQSQGS